jgi:hypothetical protein
VRTLLLVAQRRGADAMPHVAVLCACAALADACQPPNLRGMRQRDARERAETERQLAAGNKGFSD